MSGGSRFPVACCAASCPLDPSAMCTVTALRRADGWLVTMNRDERRDRPDGEPPFHWGRPDMLAPRDPEAGGTWIGVRPDGVWACLLNAYLTEAEELPIPEPQSRGRIIPSLLASDDPAALLRAIEFERTHGFRLWLGGPEGVLEFLWDQRRLQETPIQDDQWAFVTSSLYEREVVLKARGEAYEKWRGEGAPFADNGLPALHLERYGLEPTHAMLMARPMSKTRSITQIEIAGDTIAMRHWPEGGFEAASAASVQMERRA